MSVSVFYVGSELRASFLINPAVYGNPDNARADLHAAETALERMGLRFARDLLPPSVAERPPNLPPWAQWKSTLVELRSRYAFFAGAATRIPRHQAPDCVINGDRYDHPCAVLEAVRTATAAMRQRSGGLLIEVTIIHRGDLWAHAPTWDEYSAAIAAAEPEAPSASGQRV